MKKYILIILVSITTNIFSQNIKPIKGPVSRDSKGAYIQNVAYADNYDFGPEETLRIGSNVSDNSPKGPVYLLFNFSGKVTKELTIKTGSYFSYLDIKDQNDNKLLEIGSIKYNTGKSYYYDHFKLRDHFYLCEPNKPSSEITLLKNGIRTDNLYLRPLHGNENQTMIVQEYQVGIGGISTSVKKGLAVFGQIHSDGKVLISSDKRLKNNIKNIDAEKVEKLYDLKSNSNFSIDPQSIKKAYPELVQESDDEIGVNVTGLIPVIIEVIKEQQKSIEYNAERIKLLKANQ